MIVCKVCNKGKPQEEFTKNSSYASGFTKECKVCCNERARAYRKTKPYKVWKASHRESLNIKSKTYNSELRSTVKGAIQSSLAGCKYRASKKGLPCTVTLEYLLEIYNTQEGRCALSGTPMEVNSHWTSPTLDKIQPELGYIEGNVQYLTKRLNLSKGNLNNEEFLEMCKLVIESPTTIETTPKGGRE